MTISKHPGLLNPATGEFFKATDESIDQAIKDTYDRIGQLYRALAPLEEEQRERQGPIRLPAPRHQTERQKLVSRCPRCRSYYEEGAQS